MKLVAWVICAVIAVNFILFVLTFIPAFSGIGVQSGLADRLWGTYRYEGWRVDVVWVFASSLIILVAGFAFKGSAVDKVSPTHKVVVISCVAWLCCFVIYAGYVLIHMMG
jgi:hypothetical protein